MIEVLDILGSDLTVVNAARCSFAKHIDKFSGRDYKLLKYLLRHNHWTPYSHPQMTLRIKMPIFVARQWFKHMIGFSRNEVSRRYVDAGPEYYMPEVLRSRAPNKKQGSSDEVNPQSSQLIELMAETYEKCDMCYNNMIASGVCPEQARMVLPQAMMTEFYETGSLAAYLRLVHLRTEETAQKEIREYASIISQILQGAFPQTMKAVAELGGE